MYAFALGLVISSYANTTVIEHVLTSVAAYAAQERTSLNAPSDIVVIFNDAGQMRAQTNTVSGIGLTETIPVRLASFTKSYTAYVVEQLAHEKKISLNAPIQHYIPLVHTSCPSNDQQITVRSLLDQVSGIPTAFGITTLFANDRSDQAAIDDSVRALATSCFPPASTAAFAYSNANYNILGSLIQTVTGQSYESEINRRIAMPLHLPVRYSWQLSPSETLAQQSTLVAEIPFRNHVARADRINAPSAGLIGSAKTEARWLSFLLGKNGAVMRADIASDPNSYAMGWFRAKSGATSYLWAPSWGPGSLAVAVLIPQRRIGSVLIFNAAGFGQFFREPAIAQGLAESLLDGTSVRAPGKDGDEYAEVYCLPLLVIGQIVILYFLSRIRKNYVQIVGALSNLIIAISILWFFPKYGGSFATGLLFAPGLTIELLMIAGIAAFSAAYSVRKVFRSVTK